MTSKTSKKVAHKRPAKKVSKPKAQPTHKTTAKAEAVADIPPEPKVLKPQGYSILPTKPNTYRTVLCFAGDSADKVFGLTPVERLRRQFAKEGLTEEVTIEEAVQRAGPVIIVSGKCVLDQPLVAALLKRPNLALTSEKATGGQVLAANVRGADATAVIEAIKAEQPLKRSVILQRAPSELDSNFWASLRKRETPYALPVSEAALQSIEWRMFMGTYKGATDLVTKHVWPRPAFAATRWLAPRGITPNMVTSIGAIMTVAAFVLFLFGHFAWGLLAAWAMTFLDTVDGKLARSTLTSSKWGDVFDHGIDLIHPPFWYVAWALGLTAWGITWTPTMFNWTMLVIFGGYIVQRLMEGVAIKWLGLEIHIWRKIDTFFRQITARRNPNLILLTLSVLIGKPDWGLLAVAAWTAICLVLHGVQLVQGLLAKPKDAPLESWMTKP
jgi:phosphatidylglycerophosphate synthase